MTFVYVKSFAVEIFSLHSDKWLHMMVVNGIATSPELLQATECLRRRRRLERQGYMKKVMSPVDFP